MKLRRYLSHFFADAKKVFFIPLFFWCFVISLLIILAQIGLIVHSILPLVETGKFIPLHYSVYLGIDDVGPWKNIFLFPILGFVILIVNMIHQIYSFQKEHWLAKIMAYATVFFEAGFFIALLLIVLLNISYSYAT